MTPTGRARFGSARRTRPTSSHLVPAVAVLAVVIALTDGRLIATFDLLASGRHAALQLVGRRGGVAWNSRAPWRTSVSGRETHARDQRRGPGAQRDAVASRRSSKPSPPRSATSSGRSSSPTTARPTRASRSHASGRRRHPRFRVVDASARRGPGGGAQHRRGCGTWDAARVLRRRRPRLAGLAGRNGRGPRRGRRGGRRLRLLFPQRIARNAHPNRRRCASSASFRRASAPTWPFEGAPSRRPAASSRSCSVGEDVDLCWRLQLRGYRFAIGCDAVVAKRDHPSPAVSSAMALAYGRSAPELYRRYRAEGRQTRPGRRRPVVGLAGRPPPRCHPGGVDAESSGSTRPACASGGCRLREVARVLPLSPDDAALRPRPRRRCGQLDLPVGADVDGREDHDAFGKARQVRSHHLEGGHRPPGQQRLPLPSEMARHGRPQRVAALAQWNVAQHAADLEVPCREAIRCGGR